METVLFTSTVFMGENTYGSKVEVAVNSKGVWFTRRREYNGYGMGWSKWEEYPSFNPEIRVDEYGREVMKWGWNELLGVHAKRKLPC